MADSPITIAVNADKRDFNQAVLAAIKKLAQHQRAVIKRLVQIEVG